MYNKKYYLDNIFDNVFSEDELLKTDIVEEEKSYKFIIDAPGVSKDNIKLEFQNGYLKIKIKDEESNDVQDVNYIRRERRIRNLERSFYIGNIDEDKINASFNNGILEVSVPKDESKKNAIEIRVD